MFDLDAILKKIINNNRRVIIPELGAFIKNDDKTIVFSSLLKYNDGFLVSELKKEGVPNPDKLISSFIEEVNYVTDEGEEFHIEGLGFFHKDNNLQFTFKNTSAAATAIIPPAAPVPVPTPVVAREKEYIYEKENKGKFWVIFAAVCLGVVALGALYFFLFYKSGTHKDQLKPIITQTDKPADQFEIVDETNKQTDTVKIKTTPVAEQGDYNYHLIGGCFEEKINADNFVVQCKKMGYNKAKIISKIADLYPVSIESYATMDEAEAVKTEYNNKYDEEAWVYRTK